MNVSLSDKQKERLKILEPKLSKAILTKKYSAAKDLVLDLQSLLKPTHHFIRLAQSKNKLYELAIDLSDLDFALSGLMGTRQTLSVNTRIYLETTALIAICYIRMEEIEKAKPFIKEVLTNESVIKSKRTREIFHLEILNRFNEEVALCSLKSRNKPIFNDEELESEVIKIVQTMSEHEIFAQIGQSAPKATKDLIFLVYDFSTKQLKTSERLTLPSPEQKIKDTEVGKTVFQSVKRVIYNSLCNPESEIYKTWFNNGMQMVLSKGYIRSAVVTCLVTLGIGIKLIATSIIALIVKLGIEVYCERFKPVSLMDIREK